MLYLLDANIPITANGNYYPIDQVPEFWEWLQHQGERGNVKFPVGFDPFEKEFETSRGRVGISSRRKDAAIIQEDSAMPPI